MTQRARHDRRSPTYSRYVPTLAAVALISLACAEARRGPRPRPISIMDAGFEPVDSGVDAIDAGFAPDAAAPLDAGPALERPAVVFVNDDHSGPEEGTRWRPYRTIQAGVDAVAHGGEVRVAGGLYEGNDGIGEPVVTLWRNVRLIGSYSEEFSVRDSALYTSFIRDNSTTQGVPLEPNVAVRAMPAVTGAALIEGFSIRAGGGNAAAAVWITGSGPRLDRNALNGGRADATTVGLYVSGGFPDRTLVAENNTILSGIAGLRAYAVLVAANARVDLFNNAFVADDAQTTSHGIELRNDATATIRNNYISACSGQTQYAVRATGRTSVTLQNNLIRTGDSSPRLEQFCIHGSEHARAVMTIENNALFRCTAGLPSSALYARFTGPDLGNAGPDTAWWYHADIDSVNALDHASDNIHEDLGDYFGIDPHGRFEDIFGINTPGEFAFATSGLNGAHPDRQWSFTQDRGGTDRTPTDTSETGWSIGPYEY